MNYKRFNHLLLQVRDGNVSAIQPIYDEYYRSMYLTALNVLHNEEDAEDAASQAILELIEQVKLSENNIVVRYPSGYLQAIAKNKAKSILDSRKRFVDCKDIESAATLDVEDGVIDSSDIMTALFDLPEPEREIAKRFYLDEEKIKDIAKALDMP